MHSIAVIEDCLDDNSTVELRGVALMTEAETKVVVTKRAIETTRKTGRIMKESCESSPAHRESSISPSLQLIYQSAGRGRGVFRDVLRGA